VLINEVITNLLVKNGCQVTTNAGYPDSRGRFGRLRAHFASFSNDALGVYRNDIVVIGGGNLVMDASGIGIRWAVHHFWLSLLCQISGKPYYYLCVGSAPFQTHHAPRLFRYAINHAQSISVRDSYSKELLQELTGREDIKVFFDPVILISSIHPIAKPSESDRTTIGICPVQLYPDISDDKLLYQKYIELHIRLIQYFYENQYNVILFLNDYRFDKKLFQEIRSHIASDPPRLTIKEEIKDSTDYLKLIRQLDFIITSRMHTVITATSYGIPCVGYGWQPKMEYFYRDQELNGYINILDKLQKGTTVEKMLEETIDLYRLMVNKPVNLRSATFPLYDFLGL
jgi:polysaccharide pyruvyl transferase WcaK-like protein